MKRSVIRLLSLSLLASCAVGNAADDPSHARRAAATIADSLDPRLGSYGREITTSSVRAQAFFNQGLRLEYAFNHERALQSYEAALRADSSCSMCWWGIALASGPNINAPMTEAGATMALRAIGEATRRGEAATPLERRLIDALGARYARTGNRATLDSAYARAMADVAREHESDADVQTLYAAALMNLSPWNYWNGPYRKRTPRPGTTTILQSLERAIALAPDNPGACHYYIHAVEAAEPARALPCAERLPALMPGAGHLVHMPGHLYIRVGRYADAVALNKHAVHADESRIGDQNASGVYAGAYYPHNYHFMAFAATMAGFESTATFAARYVAPRVPFAVAREVPWIQNAIALPHLTLVTFGRWQAVLREPVPSVQLPDANTLARYARGVAYAALGDTVHARGILRDLATLADRKGNDAAARPVLHIALRALAGEIALRTGRPADAAREFQLATDMEDALLYDEPPLWYYPMRHSLGRALLESGRAADAERAYREDLDKFPDNGWSLFGLARSLEAQGMSAEAVDVSRRFRAAWSDADVTLKASRF